METLPLVYARDNRLITNLPEKDLVYLLDLDGWLYNMPNLELYQKLHGMLWIDNAPRRFEDVMDTVVAGAYRITIRNDVYKDDMGQIFDEIEIEKFVGLLSNDSMVQPSHPWDGVVIYIQRRPSFQEEEQISMLAARHPVHLILKERNLINIEWAEEKNIKSIIIPFEESV